MERDGERDHKRIPYDDRFKKATFPTTQKGTALVQPGKGVRMNYLDYWCDEMRDRAVERTSVAVRYDPFDVTVGFAWIDKQWRKCVCTAGDLAGCSERELQLLAAELRQQNRLLYGKEQVEMTQKQLADFRRGNAAKEVILRQQRADRETRAALVVLEGGRGTQTSARPSPPSTSPTPTPDEQAQRGPGEPSPVRPRRAIGDGDTLRVLRRIR
jgi:putative transposase